MLIKFILFAILLISSHLSFANDKWTISVDAGDTKVWKNSDYPKMYISVTNTKSNNSFIKSVEENDFSEAQYQKKTLLNLVGVTDWKVNEFSWDKKTSVMRSSGEYKDHKGIDTLFRETHFYNEKNTLQFLLTMSKEENKFKTNLILESFISDFLKIKP